jgi:TPR repeat protein
MTDIKHALLLSLLAAIPAAADTTITITQNGAACQVSAPADVAPPVTPSVAAGTAAARNRDFALARANFLPLADKGDADAQRAMGQLLMQNCTGIQDKTAAAGWLAKAADAGNIPAQNLLARAYLMGQGVSQDDAKAFALYSRTAATGNALGESEMGYLYLTGRGTAADRYQGVVWSVKAAEQGNAIALSNIAAVYLKGDVLPYDTDQAAYFLALANQRATPAERARLMDVSQRIRQAVSVDDLESANKKAMRWSPGPGSLSDVLRDADRQRKAG